jgi:archaellum biogenesis protein FlaJ (TadC family)
LSSWSSLQLERTKVTREKKRERHLKRSPSVVRERRTRVKEQDWQNKCPSLTEALSQVIVFSFVCVRECHIFSSVSPLNVLQCYSMTGLSLRPSASWIYRHRVSRRKVEALNSFFISRGSSSLRLSCNSSVSPGAVDVPN